MAIAYYASSSSLTFKPHPPPLSSKCYLLKPTPFLGSPFAAKPTISITKNNKNFSQIRCAEEATALVPLEQRWMFDDVEVKGKVILPKPPISFYMFSWISYNCYAFLYFLELLCYWWLLCKKMGFGVFGKLGS